MSDWKEKNKKEADKLRKEADSIEHNADLELSAAQHDEFYGDGALGKMIPGMNSEKADTTNDKRTHAMHAKEKAKNMRERADEIENAPIESVLGDIGKDSYKPPIESVLGDIGRESYKKPEAKAPTFSITDFPIFFSYKVIVPIFVGFILVGYLGFYSDDPETIWVTAWRPIETFLYDLPEMRQKKWGEQ